MKQSLSLGSDQPVVTHLCSRRGMNTCRKPPGGGDAEGGGRGCWLISASRVQGTLAKHLTRVHVTQA